jgi:hypothetical protein
MGDRDAGEGAAAVKFASPPRTAPARNRWPALSRAGRPPRPEHEPDVRELNEGVFTVPQGGGRGRAYTEEAFRYFLELEWKRAARAKRPFLLLLVGLTDDRQRYARIAPLIVTKLFSRLWLCLRETDVIGWYREERVIGTVVTQLDDRPATDVPLLIRRRVSNTLLDALPRSAAGRLRMHVYQLQSTATSPSKQHDT